jgi:hypothetical protein
VLDLRPMQLTLASTPRAAKNELNLTGRLDLSMPGTTKGTLTAKADTLDLTQLYDAFAGEKRSATTAAGTPTSPAPASAGNVEPEPVTLPMLERVRKELSR